MNISYDSRIPRKKIAEGFLGYGTKSAPVCYNNGKSATEYIFYGEWRSFGQRPTSLWLGLAHIHIVVDYITGSGAVG